MAQTVGARGYADVGANAVHHEIVCAGALTVDAELSLLGESWPGDRYARCKSDDSLETASVERQILKHLSANGCGNSRRPLHNRSIRVDGHGFAYWPHLQLNLERNLIIHFEREILEFGSCKSVVLHRDGIAPRRKLSNGKETAAVSLVLFPYARDDVRYKHTGPRHNRIVFIYDRSQKRRSCRRRVNDRSAPEKFLALPGTKVCEQYQGTQEHKAALR